MDQKVEIKQEPVWFEGIASTSFENFELKSEYSHLKEETKPELTEPGSTQPAADIKDEIIIEEQTVDQLDPIFKVDSPHMSQAITAKRKSPEESREDILQKVELTLKTWCEEDTCWFSESLNRDALAVHKNLKSMSAHTAEKPNHCSQCRKTFRGKSQLEKHKFVHTKERPHCCTLCGKAFSQKSTLNRHMFGHTGQRPHICRLCGKAFPDKSALKRRLFSHTGEQPYCCTLCGRKFREKSKLKTHTLTHTGARPYQCTTCDKAFSRKWILRMHAIIHTREGTYLCNVCGKTFPELSDLENHNKSRLYDCDLCNRTFCTKFNLKVHMFYHTGERPHLCSLCGKAFSLKTGLKKHTVLHTAPRLNRLLTNKTQREYNN